MTDAEKEKIKKLKLVIRELRKKSYKAFLKANKTYNAENYAAIKRFYFLEDKANRRLYISALISNENFIAGEYPIFIDKYSLGELIVCLQELKIALDNVSAQSKVDLCMALDIFADSTLPSDHLEMFYAQINALSEAAKSKLIIESKNKKTYSNVNIRAISVLQSCEMIWEDIFKKKAPRKLDFQHQHKNPFGRFVNEVYDIMGIGAQPRAAQNMLRKWEKMILAPKVPTKSIT